MRKKDVRKKKYGAGVAAVCLTGVILLAGCGSGGETSYKPGGFAMTETKPVSSHRLYSSAEYCPGSHSYE